MSVVLGPTSFSLSTALSEQQHPQNENRIRPSPCELVWNENAHVYRHTQYVPREKGMKKEKMKRANLLHLETVTAFSPIKWKHVGLLTSSLKAKYLSICMIAVSCVEWANKIKAGEMVGAQVKYTRRECNLRFISFGFPFCRFRFCTGFCLGRLGDPLLLLIGL